MKCLTINSYKYLGVDSESFLDLTFLLDQEDDLSLIGDKYKEDKTEGIFTYFLDKDKVEAAEYIANQM